MEPLKNLTTTATAASAFMLLSLPIASQANEDQKGPVEDVTESAEVLQQMGSDPELQEALQNAQGVFVIPDYAAASLILGGSGGEGVLLTREEEQWANPIMYNIGSISAGLQAGVEAGSIAMILMSEEAVGSFNQDNNFSVSAQAGLSVINWSERAQAQVGIGENDVVVWTDTEGLLGEIAVAVTDIMWDEEESQDYYGQDVSLEELQSGNVENPHNLDLSVTRN